MTTQPDLHCIILAAGKGTRMKSAHPKVMAKIGGTPLIQHVVSAAEGLNPTSIITVIADDMPSVAAAVAPHKTAIQKERLGSGDAVRAAMPALEGASGYALLLVGDAPLITTETLQALFEAGRESGLAIMAMRPVNPYGYGRLVTEDNYVTAIIEEKDCTPEQATIDLVNAGLYCVAIDKLGPLLDKLDNNNAQKEFYLTDIIAHAAKDGIKCEYIEAPEYEMLGINSRSQLAEAEAEFQNRMRATAMFDGATLIDPMSVYFSADTKLGRDVVVEPGVFFGPGVSVGDNVTIHAYSHIEGASIEDGANVGPFARIRPKSHIGAGATVGNFIEVNRSTVKAGAKSKHLSYLGDATIGEKANIGAGTVIANYDGFEKHPTTIGKGTFIGSNSTIVGPSNIDDGAYVGAASTIAGDIPADALAVARVKPLVREGWAKSYRARKQAAKDAKKSK